jgi:hypothetical protein
LEVRAGFRATKAIVGSVLFVCGWIPVTGVRADERRTYVRMKEKTKVRRGWDEDDQLGDAYTFVGIERHTKLVLCWHLGRPSSPDTFAFTEKLYKALARITN